MTIPKDMVNERHVWCTGFRVWINPSSSHYYTRKIFGQTHSSAARNIQIFVIVLINCAYGCNLSSYIYCGGPFKYLDIGPAYFFVSSARYGKLNLLINGWIRTAPEKSKEPARANIRISAWASRTSKVITTLTTRGPTLVTYFHV